MKTHTDGGERAGEGDAGELATLVSVEDLRLAETRQRPAFCLTALSGGDVTREQLRALAVERMFGMCPASSRDSSGLMRIR
jgi:hypothetical protein